MYSMDCLSALNCSSHFDIVSAHQYTLQMNTLQQCLKFCYRELCIQHDCVFSVTAQASPV